MQDDLVTCLTRQVKEEVIGNYLRERRLVELQVEDLHRLAEETRQRAAETAHRLTRLSYLMIGSEMRTRLSDLLRIPNDSFWSGRLNASFTKSTGFIRVRAITQRGKYRKLLQESYSRLRHRMMEYREAYHELLLECDAVNHNIASFQGNFDLLSILCFLRNLDPRELEKMKILGGNFTAAEISELDKNLYLKPVAVDTLDVPPPFELPGGRMEEKLSGLSDEIFRKYEKEVRSILR